MSSKENSTQPVDIESEVSKILLQIGVPAYIKGYGYLRDAILLTFKEPDLINSMGKGLYLTVAKKYQTTASSIASAIRKAIEIAWDRGDVDTFASHFGYNCRKPTNSEFIAMIADNLRLRYRFF